MIDTITWIKDGPYRKNVIKHLSNKTYLSSELADLLNINRASMSRILKQMKEKGLVKGIKAGSRTISYSLTEEGKKIHVRIKNE